MDLREVALVQVCDELPLLSCHFLLPVAEEVPPEDFLGRTLEMQHFPIESSNLLRCQAQPHWLAIIEETYSIRKGLIGWGEARTLVLQLLPLHTALARLSPPKWQNFKCPHLHGNVVAGTSCPAQSN